MHVKSRASAAPGDVVVVHGRSPGRAERAGVILEVLGGPGHEHYRVRWDEEHESIFWMGSDATVRASAGREPGTSHVEDDHAEAVPDPEC